MVPDKMTSSEIVNEKYQKSSDKHNGYFSHIFALCLPVIYMSAATVIILKVPMSLKSGCEEMFYFCHLNY